MATDKLINSSQGDQIISALGGGQGASSIATSLATIAAKSNTPYNSDNKLHAQFTDLPTYSKESSSKSIQTTDSVTSALGKLEYKTDQNASDIATNTNNILSVADQSTQYNLINLHDPIAVRYVVPTYLPEGGVTLDVNNATWTAFNISYPAIVGKKYKFVVRITATTGLNNFCVFIRDTNSEGTNVAEYPTGIINAAINSVGTHVFEFTATATTMWIGFYPNNSSTAVTGSVTMKAQVIEKSLYDAGFTDYQPYALPNTTITPALQECVDNGVKNKFDINQLTIGTNAEIDITTGTITQGSLDDTKTNFSFIVKALQNTTIGRNLVEPTTITANGVYAFEFTKTSDFNTIRIGHNGSSQDFNVKYPVSSLINGETYVLRINVTNCVQSQGKYAFTDIMICTEAEWNASQTYQPYALSNAELTSKALRKQTILQANDDFNSATLNGMYKFNGGPANNPAGSSGAYGILLVITFDNYTMQLCYDFVNGIYYRNNVSSWSAWTKFN